MLASHGIESLSSESPGEWVLVVHDGWPARSAIGMVTAPRAPGVRAYITGPPKRRALALAQVNRHVPIGPRALSWVERYEATVRPHLACSPDPGLLFLSASSGPLCAEWLSRAVAAYITAAVPRKHGSCHLFRHTCATLLLEGGADTRYVAEMLGHQKLETTKGYTRVSIDNLRQVHAACHPAGSVPSLREAPSTLASFKRT
jgi:integrase